MSDSRNIEASPQRLARVRARLGRPSSGELTAASSLFVAAIALPGLAAGLVAAFGALWRGAIGAASSSQLRPATGAAVALGSSPLSAATAASAQGALAQTGELAQAAVAMLLALTMTAAAATALQRGVFIRIAGGGATIQTRIPPETIAARLSRSIFSVLKWVVFVGALVSPWSDALRGMLGAWQRTPRELLPIAGSLMVAVLERAALALAVLGVIDFAVQQVAFRRRLRMSRQELLEEQKATEADPHATAERKRRGREMQTRVALREFDEVALVVCDFEGRAFGLRDKGADMMVWIKADGELAARVRTEAGARGVAVKVDRDLAAALSRVEIGEPLSETIVDKLRRSRGS